MKDLVLEGELMRPLDRIAGASVLKENGVDRIFKLEPVQSLPGCEQRIYLVRPTIPNLKIIANQINADVAQQQIRKYKIIFTPRKLHICDLVLEQEGVFGYVTIDEFRLELLPLEKDLLSLEIPQFFKSFFLDKDPTMIHTVAQSILDIQALFGDIPNIYGIGNAAKMTYEMMKTISEFQPDHRKVHPEIGHLFLIDRDVDFVTALASQVTYEGLVDEIFGIHTGYAEFGPEVTGTEKPMRFLLSGEDEVYEEIRNRHFSNVSGFLSAKAKELQTGYDKRHGLESVSQLKDFVSNELKGLKAQHRSLSLHIGACEVILNKKTKQSDFQEHLRTEHSLIECVETKENISYIEEAINRQYNMISTLRLLCILSQTQGGCSSLLYKSLVTQFCHSHRFEHMLTFHNLKKTGLFTENDQASQSSMAIKALSKSSFKSISKKLHLVPKFGEEMNLKNPSDMSYVFSGAYTPLTCKLVEQVVSREGFTGLEDVIKYIDSPHFCNLKPKTARGTASSESTNSKTILVYFLGGCTFTELAALRFLCKLRGWKILVATTSMINGNTMLKQLIEYS
ncbi:vacuolar protein sorting-associated protein 33B-like [Tubulanus polymorphus]|uniref:vacuolar protein sorting-associated protein 33B-like n=1 Tax=Tubulanus polymorphus TaxID=672921 RepID=UPI003DA32060